MTFLYFILAAAALGVLVFIHELGHYFVAKKMGMTVETFGIGFGRPILKWRWNDVDWQLGWLPFGGFVKIAGMEFGKKEQEKFKEPHEIPNGFFSKAPWRRICVALAGPLANFILAFLIFCAIWAMGGREKPFSDYTHIIGWVDPHSELYAQGVRPGDILTKYNGKPFTSSKDLLYASMLGGKEITLTGFHVDYAKDIKTPFTYKIESYPNPASVEGILTTGVMATARYLLYDRSPNGAPNPLIEGSPMENSGIQYGDRLVWANGEILFSMDQLSHILNNGQALLTIRRGETTLLSRQPKILTTDLILPSYVRNELTDWQYEVGMKGRLQEIYVLPYILNSEGYIEAPLKFIDKECKTKAFPPLAYAPELEKPLEPGDRIIAVDGIAVAKGYDVVKLLQVPHVQLMVERGPTQVKEISWKNADTYFQKDLPFDDIQKLATNVGRENGQRQLANLVLLDPVEAKRIDQIMLSPESKEQLQQRRKDLELISNQERRSEALQQWDESYKKLLLGIAFQDRTVRYNPTPLQMFGTVFSETWLTLKALITGYLHPKWISGPVGIVQVIHHGWQLGISEAMFWIAAISVNLGFLNLLPIPVLDGGYICLALWEQITGRRLKAKTMERLIVPFVVLLLGLLIFLTFQDLSRLFN